MSKYCKLTISIPLQILIVYIDQVYLDRLGNITKLTVEETLKFKTLFVERIHHEACFNGMVSAL